MQTTAFEQFEAYIAARYPLSNLRDFGVIGGDAHVRFELGSDHPVGSDQRVEQVSYRAEQLIQSCFEPADEVYLLVNDVACCDTLFGSSDSDHLFKVLAQRSLDALDSRMVRKENDDPEAEPFFFKQSLFRSPFHQLPYQDILRGIGNCEQGREPAIGQQVQFCQCDKDIVFYMYDDRGCLVLSDVAQKIKPIYEKHNEWIVDYHRATIDQIFNPLC